MLSGITPKSSKSTIKIRSPKSEIQLHKVNYGVSKISPELAFRGGKTQNPNDSLDRIGISQSWTQLKINALSKAIAISPDVENCTLGPKSVLNSCKDSDVDNSDEINLEQIVTSTPLKPKQTSVKNDTMDGDCEHYSVNISAITPNNNAVSVKNENDEVNDFKCIKEMCLNKIEAEARRAFERKKEEYLKAWFENDTRIKEKLIALKVELDREQLLRIQEQYIEMQKYIRENNKDTVQPKAEQLAQNQVEHDKRIAETSEKIKLIELKRIELEEEQKRKREELKQCINGIYEMQVSYGQKYNHISQITKNCRDIRKLNEKVSGELPKLKAMNELVLKLVEKSKEGCVTNQDLKSAQKLVQQISIIGEIFSRYTDEINKSVAKAEEDRKKDQVEKELMAKEEAEQQQKAKEEMAKIEKEKGVEKEVVIKKEIRSEKLLTGVEDCISGECLKWHLQLTKYLENYEATLEPLLTNNSLKKFRFDCQKVVNVPVNAISPLDDLHLEDKLYKLRRLLQGNAVPLSNSMFLATGHHLGVPYCTNLLAKKFVKQGELTVSSKPEAAFAIAAVIVALWVDFPEFGQLLLGHFHRECPYLIPAFLPQVEGQTNEDYYRQLGYQYSEDGKVESQDKFLRRMSGVMRLYAAILVTPLKRSQLMDGKKHPNSMREAWRWFAATMNLCPRPDISPTLIFDFLEVAGWLMYRTYGAQFTKLLNSLCADYFPMIEQVTPDGCGGPVVRLKNFLEKILNEGQVPPPSGLLPPNFW